MLALLQNLRQKVVIGFVGGSDLVKQQEQLGVNGLNGMSLSPIFLWEEDAIGEHRVWTLNLGQLN